ncbi:MAG: CopD family protein [Proteobacteria bacterium]|nr:CopD family protein [Alphaproteobacteria bacterium]MDA0917038.1 CopD family protein [Pseudomonadota bacterium]
MDVWIVLTPILKVLLYLAGLAVVGTKLFDLHFSKYQTIDNMEYCNFLSKKSCLYGLIISVGMIFSIAGNLGGEFLSILDPIFFELALTSKAGYAAIFALIGFILIVISTRRKLVSLKVFGWLGVGFVLLSFVYTGHSQKSGILAQILLLFHLICVAFWLGSFIPLYNMCSSAKKSNLHVIAHRFGILALFYLVVLIISGGLFAYILMNDISLLFSTSYGNAFLVKMSLVSLLLLFGALNKFKNVPLIKNEPTVGSFQLKKSIRIEMFIALLILSLTSILTTSMTLPMGG